MALNPQLLEILVCPEDKTPVKLADLALIQQLNAGILAGKVSNRAGDKVEQSIEAGLIRADGRYLYPIRNDIPIMLIDEAIPLS